jgi:hypothetical protein
MNRDDGDLIEALKLQVDMECDFGEPGDGNLYMRAIGRIRQLEQRLEAAEKLARDLNPSCNKPVEELLRQRRAKMIDKHSWKCISPGIYDSTYQCVNCGMVHIESIDVINSRCPPTGCPVRTQEPDATVIAVYRPDMPILLIEPKKGTSMDIGEKLYTTHPSQQAAIDAALEKVAQELESYAATFEPVCEMNICRSDGLKDGARLCRSRMGSNPLAELKGKYTDLQNRYQTVCAQAIRETEKLDAANARIAKLESAQVINISPDDGAEGFAR